MAEQHEIRGVPTVVVYHKGKPTGLGFVGSVPEAKINELIAQLLKL